MVREDSAPPSSSGKGLELLKKRISPEGASVIQSEEVILVSFVILLK